MAWELVGRVPNPWGRVPVTGGGQSVTPKVAEYMARIAERATRRDCSSKRHHYVPQSYMRAWSSDGKRVRVLDTRNGIDGLRGIRDTCVRENFYQMKDGGNSHHQAEAMLAVIDDETARLLRVLRDWTPGEDFDFEDFMSLAVVLAFQRNRTPQIRRYLEAIDDWQRQRANQQMPTLTSTGFVSSLFGSALTAADEHSTRQLELWDDPRGRFITCDQPVQITSDSPDALPDMISGKYLMWPISPTRLLVLSQEINGEKVTHRIIGDAEVKRVRGVFIKGAESAIIALPGDGNLPAGKRPKRPQLRVDCTPVDVKARKCRIRLAWGYGKETLDHACQPLCAMRSQ
ncbi:DUF4238 domain-containing protein [Streptomyces sp. NPDC095817]|uniref:DUF4238 domain-containing protein n=1 Tax=Streptomyces sp. NPDC095817 TaxID=3155082 RepID=UPI0033329467